MAFVLEDRVVEAANNPGQGDFELLGATDNNRTFVAAIGNGNTTRYLAIGSEGWEIGIGTVSAGSPDRLLRPGTVTKNSDGSTTPINFSGTVTVACIASVEDVLWLGENGDLPARGGRDLGLEGDRWRNLFLSGTARFSQSRAEGVTGHYRSSGRYLDLDPEGDEDARVRIFRHTSAGLSGYDLSFHDGTANTWLTLSKGEGISLLEGIYSGDGSGLTNLNASAISTGTLPNARLSGDYSFSNLTLSGGLTTGGDIQVNSSNIYLRSDSTRYLWFRDITDTPLGAMYLSQSSGDLVLRVHDASGSPVHHLTMRRDGRATFDGTLDVAGDPVAAVSTSGSSDRTDFPIGHVIAVYAPDTNPNRNDSGTIRLDDANNRYRRGGSGAILSGTWRSRGCIFGTDNNAFIFQRVA